MLYPVIICGGAGSRLWPASREDHPKPFLQLPDGQCLLEKTLLRASKLNGTKEILTVTNQSLFFITEDIYSAAKNPQECKLNYILEPMGRNTAAAITSAALYLERNHGPQATMLVLPADHLIQDEESFAEATRRASLIAQEGLLVTFGVEPTHPETGFGYIEADIGRSAAYGMIVKRFIEKPDLSSAQKYCAAGNFYWNSGMFCFQAGAFIGEMRSHAPDVLEAVETALSASKIQNNEQRLRLDPELWSKVPDISIDYALMEHSEKVATIPCSIGWSDIGSWSAMSALVEPDEKGNRLTGDILNHAATNNFVHSPDRLTALVGVEDLLVVDTTDALLIAHKDRAQDVKHIVGQLKQSGHETYIRHRTVHRPWGTYTTLEEGDRFKIKRIVVKPGASLSLQMHHHRSEHWIVVSGIAKIVNDESEMLLAANESTFIRAGHKHRLENPGIINLVLIEVQCGDYLGEDDIVRFEDLYGRTN
ncbi:mannose-1-phosphate guanylyltransferase/mannose-6-phosphate isomerase [Pseudomonas sp. Pc102]|uniref:mannose-1-phosphate guanylyltransferase/mannose-6-phosphate isomerase n=1 Tax=Pseudomonas sp. Pc102 TaxID=2678261 RepID=UPI001BD0C502|nr:mannose-1-phosphate guanylyltransferase/mannose-6-phosphate isomerase [Pseudomonas sp. Pc102]BBP86039.1 mannose-1-phosphate guanylyltransferase/mannose-6-phosphate isomerase [Pseudomonas sp. Pc102]